MRGTLIDNQNYKELCNNLETTESSNQEAIVNKFEHNVIQELKKELAVVCHKTTYGEDDVSCSNNDYDEYLSDMCHQVWLKFSNVYQKSPSHKNNNIHCCNSGRNSSNIVNKINERLKNQLIRRNLNKTSLLSADSNIQNKEDCDKTFEDSVNNVKTINDIPSTTTIRSQNNVENRLMISFTLNSFLSFLFPKNYLLQLGYYLLSLVISFIKCIVHVTFVLALLYCIIVLHKPMQVLVSRNTQDYIYPFMRLVRILSLPYVEKYPVVTNLYEESCLIPNSYYTMRNIDCWPCETTKNIVDISELSSVQTADYHGAGIPFIIKNALPYEVTVADVKDISEQYIKCMNKIYIQPDLQNVYSLQQLLNENVSNFNEHSFNHWVISRVSTARLMRKYFPKSFFIPNGTEVSVQHFLFIDTFKSKTYALPMTEFVNVFIIQASGSRILSLIPTNSCKHRCKVISTVLKPGYILFYNWLYWSPMSVPVESSKFDFSVAYMGSFY